MNWQCSWNFIINTSLLAVKFNYWYHINYNSVRFSIIKYSYIKIYRLRFYPYMLNFVYR